MSENPATPAADAAHEEGIWSVGKVFTWLAALTIAEVGITFIDMPKKALAALLIVGALWKAALVALHFMHLKVEKGLVVKILLATTVLAIVFVLGLVPDMVVGSLNQ